MTYTKEQLAVLQKYDTQLRQALTSRWTRNPGATALREIHGAYTTATGSRVRLNTSCAVCILNLLRLAAKPYVADIEELDTQRAIAEAEAEDARRAEEALKAEAKPKKKAAPKKKK
jgi:hypothetical protein